DLQAQQEAGRRAGARRRLHQLRRDGGRGGRCRPSRRQRRRRHGRRYRRRPGRAGPPGAGRPGLAHRGSLRHRRAGRGGRPRGHPGDASDRPRRDGARRPARRGAAAADVGGDPADRLRHADPPRLGPGAGRLRGPAQRRAVVGAAGGDHGQRHRGGGLRVPGRGPLRGGAATPDPGHHPGGGAGLPAVPDVGGRGPALAAARDRLRPGGTRGGHRLAGGGDADGVPCGGGAPRGRGDGPGGPAAADHAAEPRRRRPERV
ncbi:MAG: FIG01122115: hypothetical protein, partial [uncultured Friedmanniella sp.]